MRDRIRVSAESTRAIDAPFIAALVLPGRQAPLPPAKIAFPGTSDRKAAIATQRCHETEQAIHPASRDAVEPGATSRATRPPQRVAVVLRGPARSTEPGGRPAMVGHGRNLRFRARDMPMRLASHCNRRCATKKGSLKRLPRSRRCPSVRQARGSPCSLTVRVAPGAVVICTR